MLKNPLFSFIKTSLVSRLLLLASFLLFVSVVQTSAQANVQAKVQAEVQDDSKAISFNPLQSRNRIKNFIEKIRLQVSRRLYDIDTEELPIELKQYLLETPWVKGLSIIESLDNEQVLSFYRKNNQLIFNKKVQIEDTEGDLSVELWAKAKKLLTSKTQLSYKDEVVGTVIVYYQQAMSGIDLSQEEELWIKNNTVTVGIENNWPPIVSFKDGRAQGIVADFLKLVIAKTKLKVTLVNNDWDNMLSDIKSKQLDILPNTYFTQERAKYGLYTKPYFALREKLYIKDSNQSINSFNDLNGQKLAIVKGYGTIDQVKKRYPNVDVFETDNFAQSVQAVLSGKASALYDSEVAVSQFIKENAVSGLVGISDFSFKPNKLHFFTHKSNVILQGILQKGLDSISQYERNIIINNWVASNNALNLTAKEQTWLEKQGSINYVYDPDWAPFEFTNDIGQHAGIISDILKKIQTITGIQMQGLRTESWAKAIELAKNRIADMYSGVGETDERQKYMNFTSKNIFTTPYVFVSRKGEDYVEGFDLLDNKESTIKVGIVDGYTIHGILQKNKPKLALVLLKGVTESFEALIDKRIDIFVVNAVTAKHYLNHPDYKMLKLAFKTNFNLELKIALRNDWPDEPLSIINKAIATISADELEKIFNKWTKVEVTTEVDYSLLIKVALGFMLLMMGFIYWNRKLNALVNKKTKDLEEFSEGLEAQIKKRTKDLNRQLRISKIADRKQQELMVQVNEQSLITEAAEEKTRLLLTSVGEGIFGVGSDGLVNFINPAALQMLQYSEYEILGKKIHPLIHHTKADGSEYPVEDCPMFHALSEGKISQIENEVLWRKDGTSFPIEYKASPIFKNKQVLGSVVTFSDITERKNAHNLLLKQQYEIQEIHKHTRDSIEYASLIQGALIPDSQLFRCFFEDYFAIWHPKDIVGGDIYLMHQINKNELVIMVIDCTGHGVPGAFVSMLVKAVERQIMTNVHQHEIISPARILSTFNRSIKQLLKQESIDSISNAGFDGGILYFNRKEKFIRFAGAETPLFIIQHEQLKMIKGNRHSVGYKKSDINYPFTDHEIDVSIPTKIYLTTDGYLDQNGGKKGFPFGKKRFKQLIEEYAKESFADQQEVLLYELQAYQKDQERNDDVTVIGFSIDVTDDVIEPEQLEILKFQGIITQNFISACMDNIEYKISDMSLMGSVSTIVIELCQNMMNYSKTPQKGCRKIEPIGFIEVLSKGQNYSIGSKNIISIEDKQRIEPKLEDIQSLDLAGIKKRYRELRRSGKDAHEKGGGIGLYEIAKLVSEISYKFDAINDDKFYYSLNVVICPRERKSNIRDEAFIKVPI